MRIDISSRLTVFYKIIAPLVWVGLGIYPFFGFILKGDRRSLILFLVIWSVGIGLLLLTNIPLKKVWLDNGYLWVSNYIRESRLLLSDIAEVRPIVGRGNLPRYRIMIRLKSTSEFGEEISFVPRSSTIPIDQIINMLNNHRF